MTLTLWTVSGAPSPWRVALGMAFKGIESETRLLSASRREHKLESYLKLNDRGTVPALECETACKIDPHRGVIGVQM